MRNVVLSSCVAVIALGVTGQVQAASVCDSKMGNIVTNCGFERGSFSGWSVAGNLQGGIPNAPTNNYIYIDNGNTNSGNADAYLGAQTMYAQTGSGSATRPLTTLSQTLTLKNNFYYDVSFYVYNSGCADTCAGQYYEYFDSLFDGNLLTAQTNQPTRGAYEFFNFITYTGGPGSNSDLLRFDFVNDDAAFQLDDVAVTAVAPVPEPATYAPIGPALVGLLYLSRRRRGKA